MPTSTVGRCNDHGRPISRRMSGFLRLRHLPRLAKIDSRWEMQGGEGIQPPAKANWKLRFHLAEGMTLIELMIVLVVIGIILSLSFAGIRNITDAKMKSASNHLASTIRYLHNKAVTDRLYLRIVYNFDEEHSYKVEVSSEPFVISPPDTEEEKKMKKEDKEAPESEEGSLSEEKSSFSEIEEYLLKPVKLKGDIFFKDVQTVYSKEKIEEGQAYTYFFPNGFATPTIINLRDKDDDTHYSLEVLPLSGRVRTEGQYREFNEPEE